MYYAALALWAAVLIGALFYTRGDTRGPLAYLSFVIVFTISAFVLFTAGSIMLQIVGSARALTNPLLAALFLLAVFAPAFLLARRLLRRTRRSPGRL